MKLNNWDLMTAYARMAFAPPPHTPGAAEKAREFNTTLKAVPGVKLKHGAWLVPHNAIDVVLAFAEMHEMECVMAAWVRHPGKQEDWAVCADYLMNEGMRPEYVRDWPTPYQQEAVTLGWAKAGFHLWHSTGCLTGDTEISVNRAGRGFKMRLDWVVEKFNGGAPPGRSGRAWDLSIPTRVQCFKNGFILLNNLVAAFPTGEKEVFRLRTTCGHEIKATADHQFMTADGGWKKLSELEVGECLVVRGEQKNKERKPKIIYRLIGVRHHPYASVAEVRYTEAMCKKGRYKPGYSYQVHRVPEHRLVVEAHLNGMGLEEWVELCRNEYVMAHASRRLYRHEHPVSRPGEYPGDLTGVTPLVFLCPATHVVHHKNHDPLDNRLENLEVMTAEEHGKEHAAHTWKNVAINVDEAIIESIESLGVQKTYDLTMESPHNNYVANGFVVHNSGKTWSGIALALSVPGPVLVITRSAAKIQLGREIERFVATRAFVVRADSQLKTVTTVDGRTWTEFCRYRREQSKMGVREEWALLKEEGTQLSWAEFCEQRRDEAARLLGVREEWEKLKAEKGVEVTQVSQTLDAYLEERKLTNTRPFVVIGWESLVDHLDKLEKMQPKVLVLDEMHMGKGRKRWDCTELMPLPEDDRERMEQLREEHAEAQAADGFIKEEQAVPGGPIVRKMFTPVMNRAAAAALLARHTEKRISLTATPIADRVRDLWAQLDTVEPNAHGNKSDWLTRYCSYKPGKYGGMDDSGSSNLEELQMRLSIVTHKVPAHVAHKHLLHMKRRQSVYIAPEDQTRPLAGFGNEMKQARARGPSAILEARIARAASKKRKAVIDMVDDHVGSDHKVVIFTARRRDCDELGRALGQARMGKHKKVTVWSAHGDMGVEERQEIVDAYMAHPGPCILVGTMQAFGQSINLHDTDAAFMVMLPYTPEMLRQAEGRFVRLGMKRAVVIYYVIAEGTIDEHIAAILIDKLPAVEEIADDQELGAASSVLAGFDPNENIDDFAASVLAELDE